LLASRLKLAASFWSRFVNAAKLIILQEDTGLFSEQRKQTIGNTTLLAQEIVATDT